jgi:16S rRNA (guanine527-N7)-methyltransferase
MTAVPFTSWAESRSLSDRLTVVQIGQVETYIQVLASWNARLNLTGFSLSSDIEPALDRLILEPILAASCIEKSVQKLVDIGSGSGSPAIPLLIAAPWIQLTMVESRLRKSVFLREAARAVGVRATVVTSRLEDMSASHEPFDAASLRGVRLDQSLGLALRGLLRPAGPLFYFDSSDGPTPTLDGFSNTSAPEFPELPRFRLSILRRV